MIPTSIQNALEQTVGSSLKSNHSISGGCIAKAQKLTFQNGETYFLKYGGPAEMFLKEAHGLQELHKSSALRILQVIEVTSEYLLLEFLEVSPQSPNSNFFKTFGAQFAEMHRTTQENFGFYEDNFIGSNPQINVSTLKTSQNWSTFFYENRLLFQYRLAEKNTYATPEMTRAMVRMEKEIHTILEDSEEPPSLLHGDLWSGNFLMDSSGSPCLIDPAVYYGHREADLAMTILFGGFDFSFYEAYQATWPLPKNYEWRLPLYKLYHLLNHLNLFGRSYYSQCMSIFRQYVTT